MRTTLLTVLLCLLTFPATADSVPDLRTRTDGADWPTFLGSSGNNKSTETGIRTAWPKEGPPVAWQIAMGEGYGNVSTDRGRLFVFDRDGDEARLRCLHAETGEALWQQTYPTQYEDLYGYSGGPRSTPVVDGDTVYTLGVEGRLRAHHVADGKLLWDVDTNTKYDVVQNFFGVGSTPVIEGNLLISMIGGSPKDSPGVQSGEVVGKDSGIVAFDKRTGKEVYRSSDELASYSSPLVVDVAGRRLGLAFARGGLLGFAPTTGEKAFHIPWRAKITESVNAATPVVAGDRVFITESYERGGALYDLSGEEPKLVWRDHFRAQAMACHWSTPIYHEGILYGSSGQSSGNAQLRAVELETGKVRWSHPGMRRSTLLYADGHLVVLGEYGELWLVEATPERFNLKAESTLVWDDATPLLRYPAWHAPVLSHGLLYLRGKDRLVAVELIPPPAAAAKSSDAP